jgi:hypothetical protein
MSIYTDRLRNFSRKLDAPTPERVQRVTIYKEIRCNGELIQRLAISWGESEEDAKRVLGTLKPKTGCLGLGDSEIDTTYTLGKGD